MAGNLSAIDIVQYYQEVTARETCISFWTSHFNSFFFALPPCADTAEYDILHICSTRGEIGIHARFRFWCRKVCGFKSHRVHQNGPFVYRLGHLVVIQVRGVRLS